MLTDWEFCRVRFVENTIIIVTVHNYIECSRVLLVQLFYWLTCWRTGLLVVLLQAFRNCWQFLADSRTVILAEMHPNCQCWVGVAGGCLSHDVVAKHSQAQVALSRFASKTVGRSVCYYIHWSPYWGRTRRGLWLSQFFVAVECFGLLYTQVVMLFIVSSSLNGWLSSMMCGFSGRFTTFPWDCFCCFLMVVGSAVITMASTLLVSGVLHTLAANFWPWELLPQLHDGMTPGPAQGNWLDVRVVCSKSTLRMTIY